MTSLPSRDQAEDHLLTPNDCALIVIDYQPIQVGSIASMDRRDLVMNIVAVARTAKLYGVPIVLSTVNVKTGANQPTIPQLANVLDGMEALDRTTINAWEDAEFRSSIFLRRMIGSMFMRVNSKCAHHGEPRSTAVARLARTRADDAPAEVVLHPRD